MKPQSSLDAEALRRAAEARLLENAAASPPQNEADLRKLQHELEVHQIELEMQNEELRAAHAIIAADLERYSEHFDFAPVGYFNLSADGTIKLANLAGAKLVGIERARLQGRRFALLVAEPDRRAFNRFLAQVFESRNRQTCEVALSANSQSSLFVRLEAALTPDGLECRAAILNITELKRAEEAQRHSRERLSGIVNSAMDAIISIDTQQQIILFNGAAEQMFGYRAGMVIGKPLDLLIPPRLQAMHVRHVDGFVGSGVSTRKMGALNAVTGLRATGEEFPIEASISQVHVAGETLCTVILRDITQRARAEAELRESEARHRSLFENMLNGFVLCQMLFENSRPHDYIYLAVNAAFETQTGLKNVIGKKVSEVLPGIRENDPKLFEVFGRVVQSGVPERFEAYIQTMDMWFSISAYRSAPGHFAVVFDVITERKKAEEAASRIAAIVGSSDDAIIGMDLNGLVTTWNRGAENIFGYAATEMTGTSILRLFPADRQDDENFILEKIKQHEHVRHFETLRQTKDGRIIEVSLTASPIEDASGSIIGVSKIARDITERKQSERDLRQSEQQMRALATRLQLIREEERMQIAREIHDVLAQELTLLKFNVVWASRRLAKAANDSTGADVAEKLHTISEQTDAAIYTVQRIATDLRPVVLDRLGLGAAIEWQVADFEKRTGIACRATVPAEVPLIGRDHATAIFRILQESLTNIARHAHATRADVELAIEDGYLIMSVRDNGSGITPEKLSDIYSIGLSGMRERALIFGGHVDIAGAPGSGTTVRVRMPLVPPAEDSTP